MRRDLALLCLLAALLSAGAGGSQFALQSIGSFVTTEHGLGAWSFGYYRLGMAVPNARVAAGIHAFKQELIYNGYAEGIVLELPVFGNQVAAQAAAFQRAHGLTGDGVIGPNTARALFRKRCSATGVPDAITGRLGSLESANDPVAEGYADAGDEGWAQVHLAYNPTVTLAQAWDPGFAIPWLGQRLNAARAQTGSWDGAIASWNVGVYYATKWVLAGRPSSGLVVNGIDWYARAFNYVLLVRSQPV